MMQTEKRRVKKEINKQLREEQKKEKLQKLSEKQELKQKERQLKIEEFKQQYKAQRLDRRESQRKVSRDVIKNLRNNGVLKDNKANPEKMDQEFKSRLNELDFKQMFESDKQRDHRIFQQFIDDLPPVILRKVSEDQQGESDNLNVVQDQDMADQDVQIQMMKT